MNINELIGDSGRLAVVCQCIPSKTLEKDSPTPFKPGKYALDIVRSYDESSMNKSRNS